MDAKSYTYVRKNFAKTMDQVCKDHDPIIVTRTKSKNAVVIISLEDYNSFQETAYLLQNPYNAAHLMRSFQQFEKGDFIQHDIVEGESKKEEKRK